jgi:hypothetical protein
MSVCNLQVYLTKDLLGEYYLAAHIFMTFVCISGIMFNVQGMRFYSECLKRLIEEEKFKKELKEVNAKFYDVFDNMCSNEMTFSKICKKQFAPIIPSSTVMKWKKGNSDDIIIGYWSEDNSPYTITCPHQLRNLLVKLQNNL